MKMSLLLGWLGHADTAPDEVSIGWKIWPDASLTRKNDFVTAISVIFYLICVLKNENNKQTVEASKRRFQMNVSFLTGLSPILFALTVDSEELNIVRQVCISWGRLNNHEGDVKENGKKAIGSD